MRRLVLLVLTTLLAAQSAVEITTEPHHHQIFSNTQIRVFNVEIPAHSDTLLHRHSHDYIYVTLGDSEVVNAVQGKPPVAVKFRDGQTDLLQAPYAHVAHNQSDRPYRNVTVELLQDQSLRHSTHPWDESRGLDILHGGTKEILWVKDGIRATEFELQQPRTEAPISPAPYLLIALSDLRLFQWEHNAPMSASMQIHLKPGEVQWFPAAHRSMLMNMGPAAKFVTLEFP
jgi:quercetin dioxygenase-like cupin family protein